jgi:hypothetical protein
MFIAKQIMSLFIPATPIATSRHESHACPDCVGAQVSAEPQGPYTSATVYPGIWFHVRPVQQLVQSRCRAQASRQKGFRKSCESTTEMNQCIDLRLPGTRRASLAPSEPSLKVCSCGCCLRDALSAASHQQICLPNLL